MTRIGTPAAALLTLALLTSGCAGGSGGGKDVAPTKAQADAAAKAINLLQADVSADYKGTDHDSTDDGLEEQVGTELATCLKADKSLADKATTVSKGYSQDFEKGAAPSSLQVSSEVEVVTSTDLGKKQLALYTSDKTPDCLSAAYQKAFATTFKDEPGVTLGKITIKKVDADASGTDGAFGYTITLPLSGGGQSFTVSANFYGFLKKHTKVTLTTSAFGSDFPDTLKDDLYGKLVERAKKSAV